MSRKILKKMKSMDLKTPKLQKDLDQAGTSITSLVQGTEQEIDPTVQALHLPTAHRYCHSAPLAMLLHDHGSLTEDHTKLKARYAAKQTSRIADPSLNEDAMCWKGSPDPLQGPHLGHHRRASMSTPALEYIPQTTSVQLDHMFNLVFIQHSVARRRIRNNKINRDKQVPGRMHLPQASRRRSAQLKHYSGPSRSHSTQYNVNPNNPYSPPYSGDNGQTTMWDNDKGRVASRKTVVSKDYMCGYFNTRWWPYPDNWMDSRPSTRAH
ncbi:hypothetical protein C8R43DRAFT_949373 [Mycena crocata]|nr:hypothetical protein C8R43DRAFT_949373 [Mycena crocata]